MNDDLVKDCLSVLYNCCICVSTPSVSDALCFIDIKYYGYVVSGQIHICNIIKYNDVIYSAVKWFLSRVVTFIVIFPVICLLKLLLLSSYRNIK